jgi:hypothetical protein
MSDRRGARTREPAIGARVRLIAFGACPCGSGACLDDNERVPGGTGGTVTSIDDAGTVHVRWDNGRNLGLIPRLDKWEMA